jgi:ubiquinone/menaquinone biosynthesis C-methylase UbiE
LQPIDHHSSKKRDIISRYNSTSVHYDNRYAKIQNQKYEFFLKYIQIHSKIILDAGSGTGLLIPYLLKLINSSKLERFLYIGIDISLNMLKIAKRKLFNINENEKFELILADLEHMPIRDDIFHCIFSITSLQNLNDMEKGIKEIIRSSKINSALFISILKKMVNQDKIISILEPYCNDLKVNVKDGIEDFLIRGQIVKKVSNNYL